MDLLIGVIDYYCALKYKRKSIYRKEIGFMKKIICLILCVTVFTYIYNLNGIYQIKANDIKYEITEDMKGTFDLSNPNKQSVNVVDNRGEKYIITLYEDEENIQNPSTRMYVDTFNRRFEARSADSDITMSAVFAGSSNPYTARFSGKPHDGTFKSSFMTFAYAAYDVPVQSSTSQSSPAHARFIATANITVNTPWGGIGSSTTKTLHMYLYPGNSASVYVSVG